MVVLVTPPSESLKARTPQWAPLDVPTATIPSKVTEICLPQDDANAFFRTTEVCAQREVYDWKYRTPGIPPFLDSIPSCERKDKMALETLEIFYRETADLFLTSLEQRVMDAIGLGEGGPFVHYKKIFALTSQLPDVHTRWWKDEEFAYQRMNGINPTLIRRVEKHLPKKFPVTDEMLRKREGNGSLINDHTLEELVQLGRLFICDYEDLDGIPAPAERCLAAPIVLLWSDDSRDNTLMPLAIQLEQKAGSTIFTPADYPGTWLAAKLQVQAADAGLHGVYAHLWATHMTMEALYVSMRRNLHDRHPLSELLRPHFAYTVHINYAARQKLVNKTGTLPRLMAMGYEGMVSLLLKAAKGWSFERYDLPYNIQRRMVHDTDILKDFMWRDDALKVWAIVHEYVTDMVRDFYRDAEAIAEDKELASWIRELTAPVGPGGCGFRGLPPRNENGTFATHDDLILFLTEVLYNVSAGHSAVNNGQFAFMGYIPNIPMTFKMPSSSLSKSKDVSLDEIAKAMPNEEYTRAQIAMVYVLSLPTSDPLGSYDSSFMVNRPKWSHAADAAVNLRAKLKSLEAEITERNRTCRVPPYPHLAPSVIAQGVAI